MIQLFRLLNEQRTSTDSPGPSIWLCYFTARPLRLKSYCKSASAWFNQHGRTKNKEDKQFAVERQKELLPRKIGPNQDPWKGPNDHGYCLEDDIHPLKPVTLHNNVIYRMSMVPRSYDQRVKKDVHPSGFKLSSNSTGYFRTADPEKDTNMGKDRLERSLI